MGQSQNGVKMGSKWGQNGVKMGSKWGQNGVKMGSKWGQNGVKMGLKWSQNGVKMGVKMASTRCMLCLNSTRWSTSPRGAPPCKTHQHDISRKHRNRTDDTHKLHSPWGQLSNKCHMLWSRPVQPPPPVGHALEGSKWASLSFPKLPKKVGA